MAARSRSNPLALAVLALLWERPMHPYEMSMTLRERRKDESVKLNFGSLYSVVDSLVKHGLIEAASTERDGNRPTRTVYRITDSGATEAIDWLTDLVRTPAKEYPQFEAALSFLPLLGPDDVVRLLRLRQASLERQVAGLEASLADAKALGLPAIFSLESEYESAIVRAELAFVTTLVTSIADGSFEGVELWRDLHARAAAHGRLDPEELAEALAPYLSPP
ncbi:PadR family transcriptional regulator [Cellulomonas sp. Leaf395]|uniref:PadR family transcriptional regulator n=1 Tax=Cellulomonas sp. Leaf395 TaxID=1736362 RepID=UPI0006FC8EC8|nr:PadR family transcriptional regulator [Cellulomonas sp. Leaf395]KQT01929.1 PadR family transcriptional regulator [Cellulomonas sp. Leaf395]